MKQVSLAIRYRPQSFKEVVGQEIVKKILSRAAAESKVVPAYLLSGTRGVGKTTIARIFAKALNCQQAPTAEPCNTCEQCKRITKGIHVDVVEIDGASNRGVDDARRLRESIAYAPMEGRYKVFIIDEAHMLTRESFNALLKTLEEPPPFSTFVFATTEPHKFPVTIISRCQHFVLKPLTKEELIYNLIHVLKQENICYEDNAIQLIARRASGSIRDSMSLLGQTLMFSNGILTENVVRNVLGLAEQEFYEKLLRAFKDQNYEEVVKLNQILLEKGVDLGFFLREFATLWRNLFLLRKVSKLDANMLGMLPDEIPRLTSLANLFEPIYLHAAWQMVLENQRQILMSLEPPVALELLFLNLTLLPHLVSLEKISNGLAALSSTSLETEISNKLRDNSMKKDVISASTESESISNTKFQNEYQEVVEGDLQFISVKDVKSKRDTISSSMNEGEIIEEPTWEGFLQYCSKNGSTINTYFLNKLTGIFQQNTLVITVDSQFLYEKLISDKLEKLYELVHNYAGEKYTVQLIEPKNTFKLETEIKKDIVSHPVIQILQQTFDAELLRCTPTTNLHIKPNK